MAQQLSQLLSEPPANIIYYLVTLLALLAVFGISLSQWMQDRNNQAAFRAIIASGILIILRVVLLVFGLILLQFPANAIVFLPPLEQAMNLTTAVLMVWAFVNPSRKRPYLNTIIVTVTLLITIGLYFIYTIQWRGLAFNNVPYNETLQWTVWNMLQTITYVYGLGLCWRSKRMRSTLWPYMLLIMLGLHLLQFATTPTLVDTSVTVAGWVRLGYLIVFPLWAIQTYRDFVNPLLSSTNSQQPIVQQLINTLQLATQVVTPMKTEERVAEAVLMSQRMVNTVFVGIGILDEENQIHIQSNWPQPGADEPRSWQFHLGEWQPFTDILNFRRGMTFNPKGSNARHRHAFYELLEIGDMGALLVEPLLVGNRAIGFLMLARRLNQKNWGERDHILTPVIADYLAKAIGNSQEHQAEIIEAVSHTLSMASGEPETVISGRIVALEEERKKLREELLTANDRIHQLESRTAIATKRARDLALALEAFEKQQTDQRVAALEDEVAMLRESLIEAEEAMAMASASEGGLSTDWVMMTITRYSGQLEEAQVHIQKLEADLARHELQGNDDVVVAMVQELRTPMTSIAGFTELLLGETMGMLGTKQRNLLKRIKANVERMDGLLDQLVQVSVIQEDSSSPKHELVNVQEVVETAVNGVITQIREKNLHIDLDIDKQLPNLAVNPHQLYQIMTNLLGNACQASSDYGRIIVTVKANTIPDSPNNISKTIEFLQLTVKDNGVGIAQEDIPHVFDAQYKAEHPLISGLGDKGVGLSVAQDLTYANGGRLWVDSEVGNGSTFSVLFPVTTPERNNDQSNIASNGSGKGTK